MHLSRNTGLFPFSFLLLLLSIGQIKAQSSKINQLRTELEAASSATESLSLELKLCQELRNFSTDSVFIHAEKAKIEAEALKDTASLASAYRQLSWARGLMRQDIAQLIQDATKSRELAQAVGDSLGVIRSGLALARGYLAIGKNAEAQVFADEAEKYAELHDLGKLKEEIFNTRAYLVISSDLSKSLEYRDQGIRQARLNNDSTALAVQYSQKAYILKFKKSDSVAYYLQAAKEIFKQKPAPVYEGILLFNLAEYYGDLGYGDSLLYYGLKANESSEKTNYVQVGRVAKALLFAYYFNRKDADAALPFAREALEIEKSRPSINYVSAFVDMARVQAALGERDSALFYFEESEKALKVLPSPRFEFLVRAYKGDFLMKEKRYEEAVVELKKADAIASGGAELALKDFVLLRLGRAAFKLTNYREARNYYEEAVELGDTGDEADLLSEAYQGMASCDSALGNWASSLKMFQLFKSWDDSVSRRNYNEQTAEMQTRFETVQKEAEITQLKQEGEIQQLELQQTETERNSFIGIALILALAGAGVFALMMQLRKRNTEIKAQREQLSLLNDSKDRMFAMIAHDLRGPITGFQSVGKIFDHYVKKADFAKLGAISERISQQSDQLKQLLDNLLNWSLQQLGLYEAHSEDIKLHKLGKEILSRYEAHAEAKGNQLLLEIPEEMSWKGDKNGLSVVINNLVGNANKFTQDGNIHLRAHKKDNELELVLEDTGQGMTQAQLEQLRKDEKLSSQKGTAGEKGTGLGFQIIYQLLSHWKGRMELQSEAGKGTAISIFLPIEASFA
ncbi:MAG: tetratricopeptide repeat-containing sensor histidine kinase [Bacteroidota bacterium]